MFILLFLVRNMATQTMESLPAIKVDVQDNQEDSHPAIMQEAQPEAQPDQNMKQELQEDSHPAIMQEAQPEAQPDQNMKQEPQEESRPEQVVGSLVETYRIQPQQRDELGKALKEALLRYKHKL